ncbi:uncharacterized protein LOC130801843 [Amaranthus tricolor]|uniref:uncharacterized protein LOC130801843 n=1 Tax=Amaranthus tricolor TaxID=29722 RepID=UPI0025890B76|nr:uncharacterized protein LOC130801843 [Amaranthus tricolor]
MNNSYDHSSADRNHVVKGTEVFVGGLAQSLTEPKIREVFSTCGEIVEVRMIKNQNGNSKGYCFVRFSTKEAAIRAVKDKNGITLEGRRIGVLPSIEQNSLFLGNLPKGWSPDEFDRLVRQVFQDVDSVNLVMLSRDKVTLSSQKHQNRGFGFVHFSSHAAAARAYKLGSRSDFVLGGKCHPTVKWVEEEPEIDPEEVSKVKVAFIRDLPADVNESFLEKLFVPFGEIERVVLSKKGQSQVGFVHYANRQGLDNAVREMHNRTIQGPKSGLFKLLVEVARPFEKSKKRTREESCPTPMTVSQSKLLKAESDFTSTSGNVLKVIQEPVVADPYEAAVVSLPSVIQDRLLRILRLGIASRYDIDIQCLRSLKEIPESAAISVLDQFLLSGGDEIDKRTFLAGLITKYQVRSLGKSQVPEYTSRENDFVGLRSGLARLPSRNKGPVVDSYSSHMVTSQLARHSPELSYLHYSLSPQASITRTMEERNTSAHFTISYGQMGVKSPVIVDASPQPTHNYGQMGIKSPVIVDASPLPTRNYEKIRVKSPVILDASPQPTRNYGQMGVKSPVVADASPQPTRTQVRFDPFTGEPYKFDPFTGEPIKPESVSRSSRSLY